MYWSVQNRHSAKRGYWPVQSSNRCFDVFIQGTRTTGSRLLQLLLRPLNVPFFQTILFHLSKRINAFEWLRSHECWEGTETSRPTLVKYLHFLRLSRLRLPRSNPNRHRIRRSILLFFWVLELQQSSPLSAVLCWDSFMYILQLPALV